MLKAENIITFLPAVEKPTYRLDFNSKLQWTLVALAIYFVLSFIPAYGILPAAYAQFRFFELVLGAKFGSLMTLGVGPIVTAGIVLQLLVGSKLIGWRLTEEEDKKKFNMWNKILAVTFCFVEAAFFVLGGALPVAGGAGLVAFVILQIALGGIIVILLDELVSKWGFGSGVSLIILAGVGSSILIGIFSPYALYYRTTPEGEIISEIGLPTQANPPIGAFWKGLGRLLAFEVSDAFFAFLPILATVFIFFVVVYLQNVRVQIPLSFAALRGFGRVWNINLLYTSVIPIILASALSANLQLMAGMAGSPQLSSLVYYLSPPQNFITHLLQGTLVPGEVLRAITYCLFLTTAATLFSYFWMTAAGMDPKTVAQHISTTGLQIPGYRGDERAIESVLQRYIPPLAILSGIFIGLVASTADLLGAIGSGTGILLATMIAYNYYEIFRREGVEEAHPLIRKIFGE